MLNILYEIMLKAPVESMLTSVPVYNVAFKFNKEYVKVQFTEFVVCPYPP